METNMKDAMTPVAGAWSFDVGKVDDELVLTLFTPTDEIAAARVLTICEIKMLLILLSKYRYDIGIYERADKTGFVITIDVDASLASARRGYEYFEIHLPRSVVQ